LLFFNNLAGPPSLEKGTVAHDKGTERYVSATWIAGTALAYEATLVGRERAFARVPRLNYLTF
jgi:predicted nucleic acid-binding protein